MAGCTADPATWHTRQPCISLTTPPGCTEPQHHSWLCTQMCAAVCEAVVLGPAGVHSFETAPGSLANSMRSAPAIDFRLGAVLSVASAVSVCASTHTTMCLALVGAAGVCAVHPQRETCAYPAWRLVFSCTPPSTHACTCWAPAEAQP